MLEQVKEFYCPESTITDENYLNKIRRRVARKASLPKQKEFSNYKKSVFNQETVC